MTFVSPSDKLLKEIWSNVKSDLPDDYQLKGVAVDMQNSIVEIKARRPLIPGEKRLEEIEKRKHEAPSDDGRE